MCRPEWITRRHRQKKGSRRPPYKEEEELKRAPAGRVASFFLEGFILEPLAVQGDLATIFSLTSLDLFHIE